MSQVNLVRCTICDPSAADIPSRKPVGITSQEIVTLVTHLIEEHLRPGTLPQLQGLQERYYALEEKVSELMKEFHAPDVFRDTPAVQKALDDLHVVYKAKEVPATLPAHSGQRLVVDSSFDVEED